MTKKLENEIRIYLEKLLGPLPNEVEFEKRVRYLLGSHKYLKEENTRTIVKFNEKVQKEIDRIVPLLKKELETLEFIKIEDLKKMTIEEIAKLLEE